MQRGGVCLLCTGEAAARGKEPGAGFGFIRPCERAGDLFFHMSQACPIPYFPSLSVVTACVQKSRVGLHFRTER